MGPRLLLLYPPLLFLFVYLSHTSEAAPIKPQRQRQYLPPLPGYIPVYIQDGETPPDVESLSEALDQSPTQDKMDTDVEEVPQKTEAEDDADSGLRALRESEEFIVQQLTDNVRDNEVRGLVEEVHGPRP